MRIHPFLLPILLTALAGGAAAQATAGYSLAGIGCNGSPTSTCLTQNATNPTLTVSSVPNEYAYPVRNTTGAPIQVLGFDIFTVTNGTIASATVNTGLLRDNSGAGATVHTQPAPTTESNGRITVTNTQGWYSTTLYPPVTIAAGEAFWIMADAYSQVAPPQHTTGGVAGPASPWYRRPANGNVWTVSVSVRNPIFRILCATGSPAVPAMTATGLPRLGQTLTLGLSGGQPNLPGFVVSALSNSSWLGFPTPVDLGLFGAPNCFNYTSTDLSTLILLSAQGTGSLGLAVPNSPALGGVQFFNQGAVLAPGVNALGILTTNAGAGVIGS